MKCTAENISPELKYHISKNISLSDCVFRIGSTSWGKVLQEARGLYHAGHIDDVTEDEYFLFESDTGEQDNHEGQQIFLDTPYRDWELNITYAFVKNEKGEILKVEYED